jgi:hypothetical protein
MHLESHAGTQGCRSGLKVWQDLRPVPAFQTPATPFGTDGSRDFRGLTDLNHPADRDDNHAARPALLRELINMIDDAVIVTTADLQKAWALHRVR